MTGRPSLRRAPLWFDLACALVVGLLVRAVADDVGAASPVEFAIFGWILVVGQAIWAGLQVAAKLTLVALHWTVNGLIFIVKHLGDGLKEVGSGLVKGFKDAWQFVQKLYDDVLKPAWLKFWRFIDWARDGLKQLFAPIVEFLNEVRKHLRDWYDRFVRPVLDSIDIARKVLRVFSKLGLDWAKALDAKLAGIQGWISDRFLDVLKEVNKAIAVIDRVVTADGLFQRLALVRSIERDIRYVSRAFVNWRSRPITEQQREALKQRVNVRSLTDVRRDTQHILATGDGYYGPVVRELNAQWRIYLGAR